jgi:hypothetical protein
MKHAIANLIVLPVALSMTSTALADDEYSDDPVIERCVSEMILRSPEVIDNDHIVFHASRKRYYLNRLPNTCHGLKRNGRISYQLGSRLCANDRFNVLERSGSKLRLGVSCKLGMFEPISKEDLEDLRGPSQAPPHDPQPVEPAEIEDIVKEVLED